MMPLNESASSSSLTCRRARPCMAARDAVTNGATVAGRVAVREVFVAEGEQSLALVWM